MSGKKIVPADTVRPYNVIVPAVLIDGIIVDPDQRMSMKTEVDPYMAGNAVGERGACQPMLQDNRKVMAKRAAAELKKGIL